MLLFNFDSVFFRLRRPCSVVASLVLWFPCFVLLAKIENFLNFLSSEIFNLFLGESHVFRRSSFFCTFCWQLWGFEFAPASGIPVRVGDHVRTSQDPLKSEHVKTLLLSSSLASFQQFWSESFLFHVLFSLILTVYGEHVHSFAESLCSTNFLFEVECRFSFFLFPSSTGFPVKTHVFGKSFFFALLL